MRKDIKKRLEKALITLQEPGGSSIRSIIKIINHESPVLSLRKVLEALQEGLNEGFLCMYNGRFKLKQQTSSGNEPSGFEATNLDKRDKAEKGNKMSDFPEDSDTEEEEEEEDEEEEEPKISFTFNRADLDLGGESSNQPQKPAKKERQKKAGKKKTGRCTSKGGQSKRKQKGKAPLRKGKKPQKELKDNTSLCLLSSSPSIPEMKACKPSTTERPDLKKQRGPRCTSMKKDVRMPSKVHIPFVAPSSVPQKGNIFNDLARRSPDPVNGPLFDGYMFENPAPNEPDNGTGKAVIEDILYPERGLMTLE